VSRVCVVGSANVDYAVALPRLPGPGETVLGGTLLVGLGGKGANQAVAAARLGAEVSLLACVGEDPQGELLRDGLALAGVDVSGVMSAEAATGTALICVDPEGRNQIAVASGANAALEPERLEAFAAAVERARVVVCQLETPLAGVRWALALARRHGARTILNPAPAAELSDDLLRLADVLTPNESEAARLTGRAVTDVMSAAQAARDLRARSGAVAVITLGAAGCVVAAEGEPRHVPAFAVTAVDTTGAGDAFTGALAAGLAAGCGLEEAISLASAAAALACTRRGAQSTMPARDEVERFLREQ